MGMLFAQRISFLPQAGVLFIELEGIATINFK